jgi:hypothetical protein
MQSKLDIFGLRAYFVSSYNSVFMNSPLCKEGGKDMSLTECTNYPCVWRKSKLRGCVLASLQIPT